MPVNGIDDAGNYMPPPTHHRHGDSIADDGSWQADVSSDVTAADTAVSSSDVMPTVDTSALLAESSSNGASTLSTGDSNGVSTTSAGDYLCSDGSFNGFLVAMHRKMVLSHFLSFIIFTFTITPCLILDVCTAFN